MQRTIDRKMTNSDSHSPLPASPLEVGPAPHVAGGPHPTRAFTLVELLVVITIIAILAGLLLAAIGPATRKARRAVINTEINQFNVAIEDVKNSVGSYPPNAQTDGLATNQHLDNDRVLATFKRYFNKAFPSHREPPELINGLAGFVANGSAPATTFNSGDVVLEGGMNAAEALVFWVGGFSDDPKYPISGPGGPSYSIATPALNGAAQNQADPIDNRSWALDVNFANLGPRDDGNFFPAGYERYVTYTDPRPNANGALRRINFWYLKAPNNLSPYLYMDASRGSGAAAEIDPPAVTDGIDYSDSPESDVLESLRLVHAVKQLQDDASAEKPFRFANAGKFQILHAGVDEAWGVMPIVNPDLPPTIDRTNADFQRWLRDPRSLNETQVPLFLHFPEGPWTLELADTQTNFTTSTLGDSQP